MQITVPASTQYNQLVTSVLNYYCEYKYYCIVKSTILKETNQQFRNTMRYSQCLSLTSKTKQNK